MSSRSRSAHSSVNLVGRSRAERDLDSLYNVGKRSVREKKEERDLLSVKRPAPERREEGEAKRRNVAVQDPVDALAKLRKHCQSESKFPKAVSLMLQLTRSSMNEENKSHFFDAWRSVMDSGHAHEPECRTAVIDLFDAIAEKREMLDDAEKTAVEHWRLAAVEHNKLFTDDSFAFCRQLNLFKAIIDELPTTASVSSALSAGDASAGDTLTEQTGEETKSAADEDMPKYSEQTRLDYTFSALRTAFAFHRHPWARAPVTRLFTDVFLKRFNFRPAQAAQIARWVAEIRNKNAKGSSPSVLSNSSPLEFQFEAKDSREQLVCTGGVDRWTSKQSGL